MKVLNTLLNVLVVSFTLFVILLVAGIINEKTIFNIQTIWLYKTIALAGGGLMLLKILISSLYVANLKHESFKAQRKINNLKVVLYEERLESKSSSYKKQMPYLEMAEA
jgi:hypothetical protein